MTWHYMYGSATVYQIAWTAVGILGLFLTIGLLVESFRDLRALKRAASYIPEGGRHIIAKKEIRNLMQRIVILGVFVAVGVLSMLSPVTVTYPTTRALIQAAGLILAELIIVAGAIVDRRDRAELFYLIRIRRVDDEMTHFPVAPQQADHGTP